MTETTDLILAEGDDARKEAEKKPPSRQKVNYVKLKDGDQLRGFLLATKFVMYMKHGDFEKKIPSHVCTDPKNGKDCVSCQHGVKRTKTTIVPFYNVDTQQIEVMDASARVTKAVYSLVDDYGEDAVTTPIALKRSGSSTDTTYTLTPIPPKNVAKEKDVFVLPDEVAAIQSVSDGKVELSRDYYASILVPPSDDYLSEILGLNVKGSSDDGALPDVPGTDGF